MMKTSSQRRVLIKKNKPRLTNEVPPQDLPPLTVVSSCCFGRLCNKGWKLNKCIITCEEKANGGPTLDKNVLNGINDKFTLDKDYFCAKDVDLCILDGDKVKVDYLIEVCRQGKFKVCYLINFCLEEYDYSDPTGQLKILIEVQNCDTNVKETLKSIDLPSITTTVTDFNVADCISINNDFWTCGTKYKILLTATFQIDAPILPSQIPINDTCPCVFILSSDCNECVDEKVVVSDTFFPDNLAGVTAWQVENGIAVPANAQFDNLQKTICFNDPTPNQTGKVWITYTKDIEVECPEISEIICEKSYINEAVLSKCNPCACDNGGNSPRTDEQCALKCLLDKDCTKLDINCMNLIYDFECFKKRVFDWCMCKTACPREEIVPDPITDNPLFCVDYELVVTNKISCLGDKSCVRFDLQCGSCRCELDYEKDINWEVSYNGAVIGANTINEFVRCSDLDGIEFFTCVECVPEAIFELKITIPRQVFNLFCCTATNKNDDNIISDQCLPNENIKILNPATVKDIVSICTVNGEEVPSAAVKILGDLPNPNTPLVDNATYNYSVCLDIIKLLLINPDFIDKICEPGCILFKNCATLDHGITPEELDCSRKMSQIGGHLESKTYTLLPIDCNDIPPMPPLQTRSNRLVRK